MPLSATSVSPGARQKRTKSYAKSGFAALSAAESKLVFGASCPWLRECLYAFEKVGHGKINKNNGGKTMQSTEGRDCAPCSSCWSDSAIYCKYKATFNALTNMNCFLSHLWSPPNFCLMFHAECVTQSKRL